MFRCQGIIDRPDNRDTPAHTGLKEIVTMILLGNFYEFGTMRRDKLLVGGTHAFS